VFAIFVVVGVILGILYMAFFGGVSISSNVAVDSTDIQYFKDERTGLCFAIVASGRFIEDASGLGFTHVPCDSIPEFDPRFEDGE